MRTWTWFRYRLSYVQEYWVNPIIVGHGEDRRTKETAESPACRRGPAGIRLDVRVF